MQNVLLCVLILNRYYLLSNYERWSGSQINVSMYCLEITKSQKQKKSIHLIFTLTKSMKINKLSITLRNNKYYLYSLDIFVSLMQIN